VRFWDASAVVPLRDHPLRTAGALQLAALLTVAGDDRDGPEFVCLDHRLADAAIREGLPVIGTAAG
jgi:hypothetical protein